MKVYVGGLAVMALLVGCAGLKVSKGGDGGGIPYHLTRTEFVLTVDPPSGTSPVPVYTLQEVSRTDYQQIYTVQPRDPVFSKTHFKLQFGDQGELASTKSQVTEQLTPTIKALGDFIVSAVGVVAKAVASATTLSDELLIQLNNTDKVSNDGVTETAPDPNTDEPTKRDLLDRLTKLQLRYREKLGDYFVPSDNDRKWLRAVILRLNKILSEAPTGYDPNEKTTYLQKWRSYSSTYPVYSTELDKRFNLKRSLDESNDHRLLWIEATLVNYSDNLSAEENALLNVLASADAYRQVRDRLTAVRSLVKGMLEAPVNMKTRIILVEEDSIRTLEEKRLTGVWSVAEQQALDKHRAKWNETVGVVERAKRESILTDLMIVLAGQADYRHTMADYQKAREEWEKVRLVIQSRRDALSPSASSKVPLVRQVISPAVKSMEEIKTLDPQALTKSIAKDSGGQKLPPFVIVVEKGVKE